MAANRPSPHQRLRGKSADSGHERVVYLAGNLPDENFLSLTAALSACREPGLLLLDSEKTGPEEQRFLAEYHADRVLPIGSFPRGISDLENRLKQRTAPVLTWQRGPPSGVWHALLPHARRCGLPAFAAVAGAAIGLPGRRAAPHLCTCCTRSPVTPAS